MGYNKRSKEINAGIINRVKLILEDINENIFSDYLVTKNIPDPDLMIRTGGEYRISNFLLWQLAYTEIYIDKVSGHSLEENIYTKLLKNIKKEKEDLEW